MEKHVSNAELLTQTQKIERMLQPVIATQLLLPGTTQDGVTAGISLPYL
jgi:hypothetical protein